jgi:IS5 family transposase
MLVLQPLFNISDEEPESQVNYRCSFEEFAGLGVMNRIPVATTVAFFRERLRNAEVIEELFDMFETYLRTQGLQALVARSSMRLSILFPSRRLLRSSSNAIPVRRKKKSSRYLTGWLG